MVGTYQIRIGRVPLEGSGSGLLICRIPFKQIHFQISDPWNQLWTTIHQIIDLSDLTSDHWIHDPVHSLGRQIRKKSLWTVVFARIQTHSALAAYLGEYVVTKNIAVSVSFLSVLIKIYHKIDLIRGVHIFEMFYGYFFGFNGVFTGYI